jgi:hypothetical protein
MGLAGVERYSPEGSTLVRHFGTLMDNKHIVDMGGYEGTMQAEQGGPNMIWQ